MLFPLSISGKTLKERIPDVGMIELFSSLRHICEDASIKIGQMRGDSALAITIANHLLLTGRD
nr:hypothetical protein [uncultured Duncaniella sp.]